MTGVRVLNWVPQKILTLGQCLGSCHHSFPITTLFMSVPGKCAQAIKPLPKADKPGHPLLP